MHQRSVIARVYVSRKNGGRGVKSEENGLGWYVKNNIESLLIAVKTRRIITCHESVDLKEFKTIEEPRKHEQTEKRMHEEFARNKMKRITSHEDG